jgi:hypothetical protein
MGKKVEPIGTFDRTQRGFGKVEFQDGYGNRCSIQQSSSAMDNYLWIGCDDAANTAVVMAVHAADVGVKTDERNGWVPYPIPKQVLIHDRMHLNRADVRKLVKRLNIWLKTGELATDEEESEEAV